MRSLFAPLRDHRLALKAERRRLALLAAPLIGAQLLQISNGIVDTLVAGQIGVVELAAGGVGAAIWFLANLACIGLMAGLSPSMARLIGRGQTAGIAPLFQQGLMLGALIGISALLILLFVARQIDHWGFDAALVDPIRIYLQAVAWSLPPAAVLLSARNLCEATGRTRPVLVVQSLGVLVNLFGDFGLGLGWFGLPALGLAGIGWSTALVNLTMCAVLLWMLRGPGFRRYRVFESWSGPDWLRLKQLLTLSVPIALTMMFEAGLFAATAIQMGMLGSLAASAHNIAIGVTALFYMLPLGLGLALTARVSMALGRESLPSIRLRITNGLIIAAAMGITSAIVLIVFREQIPRLYTDDTQVRELAARLFLLAALFQVSDDLQITLVCLLRGLHDTRVPMLINALSYWGVGFGLGYFSAHHLGFGAFGLWFGLISGLSVAAILLAWRLAIVTRRLSRAHASQPH